jgi:KDO2-lipid IV(A) lauroyltransferase
MTIFLKTLQFFFRIIFYLPAGIALWLMYSFARLVQAIVKRTSLRKKVSENIRMVIGNRDPEQVADRLFEKVSCSILEVLCIPFFRDKHYQAVFKFEGLENLNTALEKNKGVLLVTMHAGNYEAIPCALTNKGYRLSVIVRESDDPLFEFINRCRSLGGSKIINTLNQDMYKGSMEALSNNRIVGLLVDTGARESRHIFINFLGRKVPVATGWLTLAQRAKCPVVPIAVRREKNTNIATLYSPLNLNKGNQQEVISRVSKIFEEFIARCPEEWLMFLNEYETKRMVGAK